MSVAMQSDLAVVEKGKNAPFVHFTKVTIKKLQLFFHLYLSFCSEFTRTGRLMYGTQLKKKVRLLLLLATIEI